MHRRSHLVRDDATSEGLKRLRDQIRRTLSDECTLASNVRREDAGRRNGNGTADSNALSKSERPEAPVNFWGRYGSYAGPHPEEPCEAWRLEGWPQVPSLPPSFETRSCGPLLR